MISDSIKIRYADYYLQIRRIFRDKLGISSDFFRIESIKGMREKEFKEIDSVNECFGNSG